MATGMNLRSRFQSDSALLRKALPNQRTDSGRRRPAWEARKTVLQSRLEELLVFEINRDGHREYRSMVRSTFILRSLSVQNPDNQTWYTVLTCSSAASCVVARVNLYWNDNVFSQFQYHNLQL